MIINAGLRFDMFNPDGVVLADPSDPNYRNPLRPTNQYHDLNNDGEISPDESVQSNRKSDAERLEYWYDDASIKLRFLLVLVLHFQLLIVVLFTFLMVISSNFLDTSICIQIQNLNLVLVQETQPFSEMPI